MTIEEKLKKLEEYERLEEQRMLIKLPYPIGSTLYRIDSRTRTCSYYHNTRDDMYHCIEDYKCRHICDGKCDAGVDYYIYAMHNASATTILSNKEWIGNRVFFCREDAEKELAKKREEEQQIMLKVAKKFDHPYKAYYTDYLYDDDAGDD